MSGQFTPGPWRVKTSRVIVCQASHIRADGQIFSYEKEVAWTQIVSSKSLWPEQERLANARLIAAAPELLTALQEALPAVETLWTRAKHNSDAEFAAKLGDILGRCDAAISKAKGES